MTKVASEPEEKAPDWRAVVAEQVEHLRFELQTWFCGDDPLLDRTERVIFARAQVAF